MPARKTALRQLVSVFADFIMHARVRAAEFAAPLLCAAAPFRPVRRCREWIVNRL
jgi:hypothetical protein